jgi:hypothetical protein
VSTPNDDEALLNIVQNSPFTDAVAAVNITNFPDSVWTVRRRIKANNLRNYKAATKIRLTPRHMEARIGFSLQHLCWDVDLMFSHQHLCRDAQYFVCSFD